jgi:hypothetical protein
MAGLFAKPRTVNEALRIANSFVFSNTNVSKSSKAPAQKVNLSYVHSEKKSVDAETAYYHVFNFENDNGFVIISGDDRAKEVLGYSTNGRFDVNNLPENFKYWLSCYKEELNLLSKQKEDEGNTVDIFQAELSEDKPDFAPSIAPLIETKWDQGTPYNDLCPVIPKGNINAGRRTVTGCVATAMAQIMKYHEWPEVGHNLGTTIPAYVSKPYNISMPATSVADYDWSLMTNTYGASSSDAQKAEIAKLMYHCGLSVQMNYAPSSEAATAKVAGVLSTYFGYDPNHDLVYREYCSTQEWIRTIKEELNNNRPVLHSGSSSGGGHAFICDGYDENGLFHFNWGWSGMSDGYFEISALNPSSLGIGGGTGGYNTLQAILIGVQKPTATSTPSPLKMGFASIDVDKTSVNIANSEKVNITTTRLQNICSNYIDLSHIGVVLLDSDDNIIKYTTFHPANNIGPTSFYQVVPFNNYAFDANLADGAYKIVPGYSLKSDPNTGIRMFGKEGGVKHLNVKVENGVATFSKSTEGLPVLTKGDINVVGNLYQGKYFKINVDITNTGAGEYNSNIVVYFVNRSNNAISAIPINDPVYISPGETKSMEYMEKMPNTLTPGGYYLAIMYDPDNNRPVFTTAMRLGDAIEVEILPAPATGKIQNKDNQVIYFPEKESDKVYKVYQDDVNFYAELKEIAGGYFEDVLAAEIFHTDNTHAATLGNALVMLTPNEEKLLHIKGSLMGLEAGKEYQACLWAIKQASWSIRFKLYAPKGSDIAQTSVGGITIYPNPVAGNALYLRSDDVVNSVQIFDLSGKKLLSMNVAQSGVINIPVGDVESGLYILRAETKDGAKTMKFSKR